MSITEDQVAGVALRRFSTPSRNRRDNLSRSLWWFGLALALVALGAYHWLVYTPHLDHPHRFAILDRVFEVCVAMAIVLTAALIGQRLFAIFPLSTVFDPLEVIALTIGLGLGVCSIGVLALGALHLYYPVTFGVVLLTMPVLLWQDIRRLAGQIGAVSRTVRRSARLSLSNLRDGIPQLVLAAMSLSILGFALMSDMTPASTGTGYDTYQYHWAVPLLLLRSHSWQAFPGWAHANLPFNTEMLNLVALALRAPEAALLVQDAFSVLNALLVFVLVRRYFGSTPAWLAVAAQSTIPMLIMYRSQSYVEPALLFYGFATLSILLRWIQEVSKQHQLDRSLPTLAGIFLGIALGVKYMALEYVPGAALLICAGLVVYALRARSRTSWRAILLRSLTAAAAFGGSAALAIAPWLLKGWLLLGNPVYPALSSIFGSPVWNSARNRTLEDTFRHFGTHSGVVALYHLYALDLFFNTWNYGEGSALPVGLIACASLLALPYLAVALGRGTLWRPLAERAQALVVLALVAETVLAFAVWSFSGALVERYALPAIVLATLVGATLVGWLAMRIPRRLYPISWIVVLLIAGISLRQDFHLLILNYQARSPMPILTGAMSEQEFMRTHLSQGMSVDAWQAVDYVNNTLPHDGKLLMLGRGTGYFFTDRNYVADTGGDWIPYLVSAGKTPQGMLHILHEQGYTYVVYDAGLIRFLAHAYENHVLSGYLPQYLNFQQRDLTLVARWGSVSLYRVPPK